MAWDTWGQFQTAVPHQHVKRCRAGAAGLASMARMAISCKAQEAQSVSDQDASDIARRSLGTCVQNSVDPTSRVAFGLRCCEEMSQDSRRERAEWRSLTAGIGIALLFGALMACRLQQGAPRRGSKGGNEAWDRLHT